MGGGRAFTDCTHGRKKKKPTPAKAGAGRARGAGSTVVSACPCMAIWTCPRPRRVDCGAQGPRACGEWGPFCAEAAARRGRRRCRGARASGAVGRAAAAAAARAGAHWREAGVRESVCVGVHSDLREDQHVQPLPRDRRLAGARAHRRVGASARGAWLARGRRGADLSGRGLGARGAETCPVSTEGGTRRVRLVRKEGRDVSSQYGRGGRGGGGSGRGARCLHVSERPALKRDRPRDHPREPLRDRVLRAAPLTPDPPKPPARHGPARHQ
jgi:hypothetical protein